MRMWILAAIAACGHRAPPPPPERDIDLDERRGPKDADGDLLTARAIAFTANAPVRAEPTAASARLGIVGRGARAKAVQTRPPAEGCPKRWIEIRPRGWVCESNVAPTTEPPTEATPVALDDDAPLDQDTYGTVYGDDAWIYDDRADAEANGGHAPAGSMLVRSTGATTIRGERFWITSSGALIGARSIAPISPSKFRGVAIADGELRVAWTRRAVQLRATPRSSARVVGTLPARSQVAMHETSPDRLFVRVSDAAWVARADLRIPAPLATMPPGVAATDRWFDVDLDEQILVAYEGARPVYATLVSTGRPGHATPPALARIAHKLRTTTMVNSTADAAYSVGDVPWTMFYEHTLALHGTYWHDGFGEVRSHGCVNLAPRDARVLYAWSAPEVPPGWTAVYAEGSYVRIHGKR